MVFGWDDAAGAALGFGMDYINRSDAAAGEAADWRKFRRRLQSMMDTNEGQYLNEADKDNPELANIQDQIAKGTQRELADSAASQASQFAQQGVRGGQLQTAIRRTQGDIAQKGMEKATDLAYQNAANKMKLRQDYFGNKAGNAQNTFYKNITPKYF